MRHRYSRQRLKQKPAHAGMMLRNLVTSLILYEEVRTTKKRAQVAQPILDRLIATAKSKTPHNAIRSINSVVTDKNASRKLMEVLKERYKDRPSGFSQTKAAGARKGDGAELVDLRLIDANVSAAASKKEETTEAKTEKPKAGAKKEKEEKTEKASAKTTKKTSTKKSTTQAS